jgi:3-hydroxyacyl-[acyl-carrier-protein] dehydratase
MPPQLLIDPARYDPAKPVMTIDEIRRHNPQRGEMEQLSGALLFDPACGEIVTFKDVSDAEFWIRGHIPGRPLMPGVMLIEAAAQMCSLYYSLVAPSEKFIGFGGVDGVKFRGQVVPGDRLILLGKAVEIRSRRAIFDTQGLVGDRLVFEGRITGLPL